MNDVREGSCNVYCVEKYCQPNDYEKQRKISGYRTYLKIIIIMWRNVVIELLVDVGIFLLRILEVPGSAFGP
jgi:hypothetical protein